MEISDTVSTLPEFLAAERFAYYWPLSDEVDVRPLARLAGARGKRAFLPVTRRREALRFVEFTGIENLKTSHWGIREPNPDGPSVAPEDLDCVILPCVAFDSNGNRIGMGGGFYDRTFESVRLGRIPTPALIGVAFEAQRIEELIPNSWDVALDAVVTELGVQRFR